MKDTLVKTRLLKIYDIIRMQSDEEHPLTSMQIIAKLKEKGITCARGTLYDDINALIAAGFDIKTKRSSINKYYMEDDQFEVPELKILIDAIACSNFVTESKSKVLNRKIASLAGTYKAEVLTHNILYYSQNKRTNEDIYKSVGAIEKAIQEGKKIKFKYFDTNIDGEKIYRRNQSYYIINPVRLTLSDNKYYLLCYSDKHPLLSAYRVDRMASVIVTEDDKIFAKCEEEENVTKFLNGTFNMFSGKEREVIDLVCKNTLAVSEIINDKFGQDKIIINKNDDYFTIRATIGVGPTFFAWLATFNGDIKIDFPQCIRDDYKEFLLNNINNL